MRNQNDSAFADSQIAAIEAPLTISISKSSSSEKDFDFAIGDWQYTTYALDAQGGYTEWPEGSWRFWRIIDDCGIQDSFEQPTPEGNIIYGTMIRRFSAERGIWHNRGVVNNADGWCEYESRRIDDTIEMYGSSPSTAFYADEGSPAPIERVTFYDIESNCWKRRMDLSLDNGETWIEKLAMVEARRSS